MRQKMSNKEPLHLARILLSARASLFHPLRVDVLTHFEPTSNQTAVRPCIIQSLLFCVTTPSPASIPLIFVALSSYKENEFDEITADGLLSQMDVHDFMARSSEALILTDGQGKITAINKAWVDMCGYTADEVGGKTCAILQGQETDMEAIAVFNQQIQNKLPA